ncbi:MAG: nucleotide sugar dehydrogenase [Legionellaceae bacterium]|nr:nucleotide sugar dehydrogenase [Legionellaceae bacterium]
MKRSYAVVGLGYVGIELLIAIAQSGDAVIGYDTSKRRIKQLRQAHDLNGIIEKATLQDSRLVLTNEIQDIAGADFYIVTVPTPAYFYRLPDLSLVETATRELAAILKQGDIIVYESTVYPGATEEVCIPILEQQSGLHCGRDFNVGYSPERISPKDPRFSLAKVVKVIGAQNEATLQAMAALYENICQAVHRVSGIKAAEATKILENSQRDVNIAFMNEFAKIMHALHINTREVIDAAKTKCNFVDFKPGLVGGHCISVDPLYLAFKAERHGVHADVILAARRVNDDMTSFIISEMLKHLVSHRIDFQYLRVGVLGLSYKANVSDIRNSLSLKLLKELNEYQIEYMVHDPYACPDMLKHKYGIELKTYSELVELDVLILTVGHQFYLDHGIQVLRKKLKTPALMMDIPAVFTGEPALTAQQLTYWTL